MDINPADISKGVDGYAFLCGSGFSVEFSKPADWGNGTETDTVAPAPGTTSTMQSRHWEIAERDIGLLDHTGRFSWSAKQGGTQRATHYADIAPSTGNLGEDTDMADMMSMPSAVDTANNYALSYGFYDSGPGWGVLTDHDQAYVNLTESYEHWMADLAKTHPQLQQTPFSVFALPGAHDAGTFDLGMVESVLDDAQAVTAMAGAFPAGALPAAFATLAKPVIRRAIINEAVTQKDNVTTLLNLGVRFFDFRPGYCVWGGSGIYHQHTCIPGYAYQNFLDDVLHWLTAHPGEIVVVSLGFNGFMRATMDVKSDDLDSMLGSAVKAINPGITPGDKSHLGWKVADLIAQGRRLIVLKDSNMNIPAPDAATTLSSWNGTDYDTANVDTIIHALNGVNPDPSQKYDLIEFQLQGTASELAAGVFTSIATLSNATSPLMSTKAAFDSVTYPWVLANVPQKVPRDAGLVVLANDFADNALTSCAIAVTTERLTGQQAALAADRMKLVQMVQSEMQHMQQAMPHH